MSGPLVRVHRDAAVLRVTLDSPHNRNALSTQLLAELNDSLDQAEATDGLRAVVIDAAGPVFCSGADLAEASNGPTRGRGMGLVALQRRIAVLELPVVVRLDGAARAGGLGLVAAADIVLAADDVTFAMTEVRLAVAPAVISLTLLERVPSRTAADLFLTGRTFTAVEARAAGLVTHAVPRSELDGAESAVLADLVRAAPQGLRATKSLVNAELVERIDRLGQTMSDLSDDLFASPDAREAMALFLKR